MPGSVCIELSLNSYWLGSSEIFLVDDSVQTFTRAKNGSDKSYKWLWKIDFSPLWPFHFVSFITSPWKLNVFSLHLEFLTYKQVCILFLPIIAMLFGSWIKLFPSKFQKIKMIISIWSEFQVSLYFILSKTSNISNLLKGI